MDRILWGAFQIVAEIAPAFMPGVNRRRAFGFSHNKLWGFKEGIWAKAHLF